MLPTLASYLLRPRPMPSWTLYVQALRKDSRRGLLTMVAMAFATLTLALLFGFAEGLKRESIRGMEGAGVNLAWASGGRTTRPWKGMPANRQIAYRPTDDELLRERVLGVVGIAIASHRWATVLRYQDTFVSRHVAGVGPDFPHIRAIEPRLGGRMLNYFDHSNRRRVIFLGDDIARDLFGDEDGVGKTIEVNGAPYTVVGTRVPGPQDLMNSGPDRATAFIPLSTFRAQFGDSWGGWSSVVYKVDDESKFPQVERRLLEVTAGSRGFDPEDEAALWVWDTAEIVRRNREFNQGLQMFLGGMGVITLLSAAIGLANIMYAMVRRRLRTFGVMMATGARSRWILLPLVAEGLTYTVAGGLLGLGAALGIMAAARRIHEFADAVGIDPSTLANPAAAMLLKPVLPLPAALAIVGVMVTLGALASYLPAKKASRIAPAQVLRGE